MVKIRFSELDAGFAEEGFGKIFKTGDALEADTRRRVEAALLKHVFMEDFALADNPGKSGKIGELLSQGNDFSAGGAPAAVLALAFKEDEPSIGEHDSDISLKVLTGGKFHAILLGDAAGRQSVSRTGRKTSLDEKLIDIDLKLLPLRVFLGDKTPAGQAVTGSSGFLQQGVVTHNRDTRGCELCRNKWQGKAPLARLSI